MFNFLRIVIKPYLISYPILLLGNTLLLRYWQDGASYRSIFVISEGEPNLIVYLCAGLPVFFAKLFGRVSLLGAVLVWCAVFIVAPWLWKLNLNSLAFDLFGTMSSITPALMFLEILEYRQRLCLGMALLSMSVMYSVADLVRGNRSVRGLVAPVICLFAGGLWMATYSNPAGTLQAAVLQGDLRKVQGLLDKNIDVNMPPYPGYAPPLAATLDVAQEDVLIATKLTEMLLRAGADPNFSVLDDTLLNTAIIHGYGTGYGANKYSQIIDALIESGANVHVRHSRGWWSPLYRALALGETELARAMVASQPYINGYHGHVWTPLHELAARCALELAGTLLDLGVDVNSVERKTQATPLYWAALHGHPEMIALLHDYGADMDAVRLDGKTALQIAMERGHASTTLALLQAGALLPLEKEDTPEAFFARSGKSELRELGRRVGTEIPYFIDIDGAQLHMSLLPLEPGFTLGPQAHIEVIPQTAQFIMEAQASAADTGPGPVWAVLYGPDDVQLLVTEVSWKYQQEAPSRPSMASLVLDLSGAGDAHGGYTGLELRSRVHLGRTGIVWRGLE